MGEEINEKDIKAGMHYRATEFPAVSGIRL